MILRTYFNNRVDTWDETVAEKDTTKLEVMAKRLELKPGAEVLDIGTGTGVFLPFILSRIGGKGQIIAIDIAEKMLKKAQTKNFRGNINYLQADIINIPLGDRIFDRVVCYSSFPHFQDKGKALDSIYRVLKRGGRLYICHTSSREHINGIHSRLPDVKEDLIPDLDDMRLLLSNSGFIEIKITDDVQSYLASAKRPQ